MYIVDAVRKVEAKHPCADFSISLSEENNIQYIAFTLRNDRPETSNPLKSYEYTALVAERGRLSASSLASLLRPEHPAIEHRSPF